MNLTYLILLLLTFTLQLNAQDSIPLLQYYIGGGYSGPEFNLTDNTVILKRYYSPEDKIEGTVTLDTTKRVILKAYFTNGSMVYSMVYDDFILTGPFIEYYYNGNIKRQGNYFNQFKTGEWIEYYNNGKKKSQGKYILSESDSVLKDKTMPDVSEKIKDRIYYDTIIYGLERIQTGEYEIVENGISKTVKHSDTLTCKDVWFTVLSAKDSTWTYWNSTGQKISDETYKDGVLLRRKKYKK